MANTDLPGENYLTLLAEMEQSWQSAVDKALSVREDQLTTARQVIVSMREQIQQLESIINIRDKEIDTLRCTLLDVNKKLDSTREDMATLLESSQKQLEDRVLEHQRQLERKDREMADLRTRHKLSIQELARGAKETLLELETQLEAAGAAEEGYKKQLAEATAITKEQARRLEDWNRVSEKMCQELDEVKGKLKSSKFANGKLREEMALWKKYAEKVEEERKAVRREVELEKKVLNKFNQVDGFLRTERQYRNLILDTMNRFGRNLMKDLKQLEEAKQSKMVLMTEEIQTDLLPEWEEKDLVINLLKQKILLQEEELKKKENDLENLSEQNVTLREVIKAMKKERESLEREKEQMEEEVRVSKLEESVRLIKNNLINEQKDVCVWNALQDVKKEVSSLKNKNLHFTSKIGPESSGTLVMRRTNLNKPVAKEFLGSRGNSLKI